MFQPPLIPLALFAVRHINKNYRKSSGVPHSIGVWRGSGRLGDQKVVAVDSKAHCFNLFSFPLSGSGSLGCVWGQITHRQDMYQRCVMGYVLLLPPAGMKDESQSLSGFKKDLDAALSCAWMV